MRNDLRETVARIIDPQAWETYDYVAAAPHGNEEPARRYTALSKSKADAIIATIRDALLTDEVVEAGARILAGENGLIQPYERRDAKRLIEVALLRAIQTKESGHG